MIRFEEWFEILMRDQHETWEARHGDVPHDHTEFGPGCFRCDLSRDES